jgi:lysophospholipase L1-like esterase
MIRCPILIAAVLLAGSMKTQTATTAYPFIDQSCNHISFSPDSSAFLNFCSKLEQMKGNQNRRINIVHMGGSHIQGGIWSNVFLSHFQEQNFTAGGGYFIFPYRIAKTNGQPYATSFSNGNWKRCRAVGKEYCLPLGMSALSISSHDSSNYFGTKLTDKAVCKYVNIVKVYHNFNTSFSFTVNMPDSVLVDRKENEDQGYSEFRFVQPIDSVCFRLTKVDTTHKEFIVYGLSMENDLASGFYLAALGANGASSNSFLRCERLVSQLSSLHADLFILSLGVNDTQSKEFGKQEYIENYDSLITFIRMSNPEAAILLTTTTDNYIKKKTSNKRTITARDAMFELAEKHHVAVWDLFSLMGGYKSMSKWYKAGLASKDKVHFTPKGYRMLGDLMYEAVQKVCSNQKNKK